MDKESGVSINEFVIQEAKEKSYEIEVRTLKEFEREQNSIVEKELDSIRAVYEKKNREVEMQYRIKRSTSINNSRLENMEARNKAMMKLFSDAQFRVLKRIQGDNAFYRTFLSKIMVQGFIKLFGEPVIIIRCLNRDHSICESVAKEAVQEFIQLIKEQMNQDVKLEVIVDSTRHLEERKLADNSAIPLAKYDASIGALEVIHKNEDDRKCFGGIVLTNKAGDIIIKNTLDVRCELAFQDSLPEIRRLMFSGAK